MPRTATAICEAHHLVLDSCSAGASATPEDDFIVRDEGNRIDWEGFEGVRRVFCTHV